MKFVLLLVFAVCGFTYAEAFIMFPFNPTYLIDSFFKFYIPTHLQSYYEKDLMKYATSGENCNRKCTKNDRKVCYFKFTLEYYQVMGGACNNCLKGNHTDCFHTQCIVGDGIERTFLAVNRQLPGPAIQVCQNDIIVVDVENELDGMATTIHWHGFLQKQTQYSDGVPFLTQCPIHFSSTFRYTFYAKESGTHFYHSHAGLHKTNGLYGALIVRSKPFENLYEFDYSDFYIFCADWMHEYAEEYYPGLASKLPIVHSILINGHGKYLNKTTMKYSDAPLTLYNVQPNKRYRFRIINAAFNVCPFQIQIERHNFTIIESDGEQMEPMTVDTLYFLPGERYDIIVHTIHEVRDYWIRVTTLFPCININTIEGFAVLRYHNKVMNGMRNVNVEFVSNTPPLWNESFEIGKMFNTPQPSIHGITIAETKSYKAKENFISSAADQIFYLIFDTPLLDNEVLFTSQKAIKFMVAADKFNLNNAGTINNISLMTPPFPLLTQRYIYNESIFCDMNHLKNANCIEKSSICQCIHRLKVKLGSIVELVLVDLKDPFTHPFHLHGHKFYVMDMGILDTNLTIDGILKNGIKRPKNSNENPPLKDTIQIPNNGYVRIKFKADNPGFWIGHCHFDFHLALGMAVIFQVGELNEMKKPPDGYIECNNFMPNQIV